MKKNLLAIALAGVIFAGCSGPAPQAPPATQATQAAATQAPEAKAPETKAPETQAPAPKEDIVEINMVSSLFSDPPDMANEYWSKWEELTHSKLNIEWIPSGDFHNKYHLMLNSGNIPDISAVPDIRTPTLITAIENGAFRDLTEALGDLSQYPNFKNNLAPDCFKYLSVNNKIYALPRSRSRIDNGIKMRKDWLDKLNIPVPTTIEEYQAALKAIVESDVDGNGQKDTIGLLSHLDPPIDSFVPAFTKETDRWDADGGFIHNNLTDGYTKTLEWLRTLYADGLLAKEFASIKNAQAIEIYTTGQAASYQRSILFDYEWEQAINKVQPNSSVIDLKLKGPEGYAVVLSTGVSGGFYISKKSIR